MAAPAPARPPGAQRSAGSGQRGPSVRRPGRARPSSRRSLLRAPRCRPQSARDPGRAWRPRRPRGVWGVSRGARCRPCASPCGCGRRGLRCRPLTGAPSGRGAAFPRVRGCEPPGQGPRAGAPRRAPGAGAAAAPRRRGGDEPPGLGTPLTVVASASLHQFACSAPVLVKSPEASGWGGRAGPVSPTGLGAHPVVWVSAPGFAAGSRPWASGAGSCCHSHLGVGMVWPLSYLWSQVPAWPRLGDTP